MSNTKIFKKDIFAALAQVIDNNAITLAIPNKGNLTTDEVVKFLNHEIELATRKNTGTNKPTEKQVENERIKSVIFDTLKEKGKATVSELQKRNAELGELQNQKISALLRQMIEAGTVERTVEKRKAYFSAVEN